MQPRTAFTLATALTAFLLVGGGALAARLTQSPPTSTATPVVATPLPGREAEYQALIDQANQQLQAAYARQQTLEQQLAQNQAQAGAALTSPTAQPQAQTNAYPVSPEMAVQIALTLAPTARLQRPPELVNFQGVAAYEVALDQGLVYVDATNGQVLNSQVGATARAAAPQTGETHREERRDESDSHEGGGSD